MSISQAIVFGGGGGQIAVIDARLQLLENNEEIFGLFSYQGISTSGQITIPAEAVIYDWYNDGVIDAFVVEADANEDPTTTPSTNSSGQIVHVSSLDSNGNFVLDSEPTVNSCIMYYVRIKSIYASNISLDSVFERAIPLNSLKAQLFLNQIDLTNIGDDKGVIFLNQLSCAGEIIAGLDSYPVPIAFHCNEANTTGKTITGATDISTILQSDNNSSTGLFGGITTGSYILVGSIEPFEGAKVKYNTLGTVEPDNIIAEFYQDDTELWRSVAFMGTNSDYPYEAHGDSISQPGHSSEQIFFGFNPFIRDQETPWQTTTFNINGADLTYRWARFRITSDIILDPIVEQIKLHTDRIEHEARGTFRYGRARTQLQLFSGINNIVKNTLSDPSDQSVAYTPNYSAAFTDNEFADNVVDGFGVLINRIFGLDTSVPLVLQLSFYPKPNTAGNVHFQFEASQVVDGFVYDGTEPYDTYESIVPVSAGSANVRQTSSVLIPINKLSANSGIVINVKRDATVGNTNDTLAGSIVITNVVVYGYKWKD